VKQYCEAEVGGHTVRVVDPTHFHAAPAGGKGQGLFCRVALDPGDCWWPYRLDDPRFVARVLAWSEYQALPAAEKRAVEVACFVDGAARSVVLCAEPFCRVNHARAGAANSRSDDDGNSVALTAIPAGVEITIPYDYEAVVSLVWKFPAFRDRLTARELADEGFLFRPVAEVGAAAEFLNGLT
jgi:hypothetical protein